MKPSNASIYPVKIWGTTILFGSIGYSLYEFKEPFWPALMAIGVAVYYTLPLLLVSLFLFDYVIAPRFLKSWIKKAMVIFSGLLLSCLTFYLLGINPLLIKNSEGYILPFCYFVSLIISTILIKLPSKIENNKSARNINVD